MNKAAIVSPSIMIDLVDRIEKSLWDKYETKKYQNVKRYIARWHEVYDGFGNSTNFDVVLQNDGGKINLPETLDTMDDELLFKVAVDLGIEVPGLIYAVPEIKGLLSSNYEDAGRTFDKAFEKVFSEPSTSIIMANSALERIIKKICEDSGINDCKSKDTLYKLASHLLKEFNYFPDKKLDINIRNVGSGLLKAAQAIESIRSNNTEAHGTEDEIINDPIYAMFIVNAVSTIGLFLLNYYEGHYQKEQETDDTIPF